MAPGQDIGYVRVSSGAQNTARQLDGVQLHRVFEEKVSGKSRQRPELEAALGYIREGDTLHVHSIDRLARNLQDLLGLLSDLTGRGVAVKFHKEGLTFTGKADPFQALQLQIIGAVAEFERALINERRREGMAAAKKAGKHLGRKATLTPKVQSDILARRAAGEKVSDLADEYRVSREAVYRVLRRIQEKA